MNRKYIMVGIFALTLIASAQPPDTLWTRTYGGGDDDEGYCVQQTQDGGYIIAGSTMSFGAEGSNLYLIKTDAAGDTVWTRTYGGNSLDVGSSVQQIRDGGYIVAGSTESYGAGLKDVYLIKTNAAGDTVWTRTYGGSAHDFGYSVQQTQDDGYIVAGSTYSFGAAFSDVYLIKTDATGEIIWTQTYGGSATEYGYSVQITEDGGYIVTGYTQSFGAENWDIYLIKTDASGNRIWTQTYGGGANDYGYNCQQTLPDGGYIVVGTTYSFGAGATDVYLIKTDAEGNATWTQTYGGSGLDYGHSVRQTLDGGYIIAGYSNSFGVGGYNIYLVKTDAVGNETWTQTYGVDDEDYYSYCIQQTLDGGFIATGYTWSFDAGNTDVYLLKIYSNDYTPTTQITSTPVNPPIVIPANGGSFQYETTVRNLGLEYQTFHIWNKVQMPDVSLYGPVFGPLYRSLQGGANLIRQFTQIVPAHAPAGEYQYIAYTGIYPNNVSDSSYFTFTKLATGDAAPLVADWCCDEFTSSDVKSQHAMPLQPESFTVLGVYPNPFNPITVLSFEMRVASLVNLSIYDISGRLITTLVNGWRETGSHQVTFDGTELPSGVYLCRLEAGGFTQSRKLVLLK